MQDLTDGVGSTSGPVYGLDSWNQEIQALSPLGSFASPSVVSMELTDMSQEYGYNQTDDTANTLGSDAGDRSTGMPRTFHERPAASNHSNSLQYLSRAAIS